VRCRPLGGGGRVGEERRKNVEPQCWSVFKNVDQHYHENVDEPFEKNVGFNIFVYTNVVATFSKKMLVQLFMKKF
jgi:hypothetical protein